MGGELNRWHERKGGNGDPKEEETSASKCISQYVGRKNIIEWNDMRTGRETQQQRMDRHEEQKRGH